MFSLCVIFLLIVACVVLALSLRYNHYVIIIAYSFQVAFEKHHSVLLSRGESDLLLNLP
ncbi:MAG: hypothetical protein ACR5K4_02460 [Sodalis sp. (in: enterobacteria)]